MRLLERKQNMVLVLSMFWKRALVAFVFEAISRGSTEERKEMQDFGRKAKSGVTRVG